MILSDGDIRKELASGQIEIEPFDEDCVQPSSVDLLVDTQFRVFANSRYPYIDVRRQMPDLTELVEVKGDDPFILHPGEFVLGSTLERVRLPDDMVARLEGKSSLGQVPGAAWPDGQQLLRGVPGRAGGLAPSPREPAGPRRPR